MIEPSEAPYFDRALERHRREHPHQRADGKIFEVGAKSAYLTGHRSARFMRPAICDAYRQSTTSIFYRAIARLEDIVMGIRAARNAGDEGLPHRQGGNRARASPDASADAAARSTHS